MVAHPPSRPYPPILPRSAATLLGVAAFSAAYYAAGLLSLLSRFPSSGTALIWLGTPVLLAVLLVTPRRDWWLYCLALVPLHTHLILSIRGSAPLVVVLIQAAGNCATALLAAAALRPLIGVPPRLVGLRNVSLFIVIACVACPALVSSAVVFLFKQLGWPQEFWLSWRTRTLSNAIGHLIAVPLALWVMSGGIRAVRNAPLRRYIEFAVLAVALTVVALIAFGEPALPSSGSAALLYAPLLLLLWAAVRFDLSGLCAALLVIALASLSHAIDGRGPFAHNSLLENALAWQLFLFAVAVPLILLSAVIREQRETFDAVRSAEAALRTGYGQIRDLAKRLVSAQEAERRRIARDLHDDLSQQMALLSLDIQQLARHARGSHALTDDVSHLSKRASGIAAAVHSLARHLHPSRLEMLGLVAAVQGVCSDTGQHGVAVDFVHRDVPESVDPDVALSLYRIVQEGLQNVVKHSGAQAAYVSLVGSKHAIDLRISDHGVGFAADESSPVGIGLISMRERAGFAGGTIAIQSAPGAGTQIDISVPLS